jgi:glycosyltransferase involved in cell wall biosynthesis
MSEHEGFNVPLVESMYYEVPIIAYNTCAIPYTLGDAGILINKKEYGDVAECIHILLNNLELKERIIFNQKKRLQFFNHEKSSEKLFKIISDLLL